MKPYKLTTLTELKNKAKELKQIDPYAEAEKISGTSYKTSDITATLGLGIAVNKNAQMKDTMRKLKDTYFGIEFDTVVNYLENDDYELIYKEEFVGICEDIIERFFIFWKDGLLVNVESYRAKSLNSGTCSFNYEPNEDTEYGVLNGCSHGRICKGQKREPYYNKFTNETTMREVPVWSDAFNVSYDIREGFFLKIEELKENGRILSRWMEPPFLWFVNYMEVKIEGYDYNKINYNKIQKFPLHVIEGMFGSVDGLHNHFQKKIKS